MPIASLVLCNSGARIISRSRESLVVFDRVELEESPEEILLALFEASVGPIRAAGKRCDCFPCFLEDLTFWCGVVEDKVVGLYAHGAEFYDGHLGQIEGSLDMRWDSFNLDLKLYCIVAGA